MAITDAFLAMDGFQGASLTKSLSLIERNIVGLNVEEMHAFCGTRGIDHGFIASAVSIKKLAGQINVIIHASGILCSLPHILAADEVVESVSLGAGNTGRKFDLETNQRVAEFKFIDWQGGAETIRQNSIFKDFFELAEHKTTKRKYLYVIGTDYPLRFLQGGRTLSSVLSRNPAVLARISEIYGDEVNRVRDYYKLKALEVEICDVAPFIGRAL
jgi:hypothetical protein